ncbi:MAG: 16S rRNA (guanine(527)-N(7))-methyltransferase RsmG [SAR202 cluster bacterium Io17-Chloro-G9]|nr:MAG: 16S rRNA (guanine(527)-N(7))-methyltransferase RsmG [SAR202 cluster bacterium Io17-Chloro-G9]
MELLAVGATRLGIVLSDAQLDQFETYYHQLVQWNQRANLTNITEYAEVQTKHFLDSLTAHAAVGGIEPTWRVLDVGAGAGLPGLPLKIAFPDLELVLVESVRKKTGFLEQLQLELKIDGVEVLTERAESLAHHGDLRETQDIVLARGLARMPVLLEYTLPFCRMGGKVVAMKHSGPALDREVAGSAKALEVLGGKVSEIYRVDLPALTDNRVVVVVEKVGPTSQGYPRRTGIPAKRPL